MLLCAAPLVLGRTDSGVEIYSTPANTSLREDANVLGTGAATSAPSLQEVVFKVSKLTFCVLNVICSAYEVVTSFQCQLWHEFEANIHNVWDWI